MLTCKAGCHHATQLLRHEGKTGLFFANVPAGDIERCNAKTDLRNTAASSNARHPGAIVDATRPRVEDLRKYSKRFSAFGSVQGLSRN